MDPKTSSSPTTSSSTLPPLTPNPSPSFPIQNPTTLIQAAMQILTGSSQPASNFSPDRIPPLSKPNKNKLYKRYKSMKSLSMFPLASSRLTALNIMGGRKKKERKYVDKECYSNNPTKKLKFTNDLEAEKVSICLDSSNTEEVIQEYSNAMEEESTSPSKLNDEILLIDEGGNISLSSDTLRIMGDRKKGKQKYVNKECYANDVMKKLKFTNDPEVDKVSICLDSSSTEEVIQEDSNAMVKESTSPSKLNDEILIIDEGGHISLSSGNNLAEFVNTVEPPIAAEDVMFVDEAGVIYGSLINYSEVHLEIVKKNAGNVEQVEPIFYVDEVGSIHLSINAKFIESDSLLPFENSEAVKIHLENDEDLEVQMKIKRLKEEISSLVEQIKYIESLG